MEEERGRRTRRDGVHSKQKPTLRRVVGTRSRMTSIQKGIRTQRNEKRNNYHINSWGLWINLLVLSSATFPFSCFHALSHLAFVFMYRICLLICSLTTPALIYSSIHTYTHLIYDIVTNVLYLYLYCLGGYGEILKIIIMCTHVFTVCDGYCIRYVCIWGTISWPSAGAAGSSNSAQDGAAHLGPFSYGHN